MVPRRGLEPPRPCERQHLKLVRLPIPPPGHVREINVVGGGDLAGCGPLVNWPPPAFQSRRRKAGTAPIPSRWALNSWSTAMKNRNQDKSAKASRTRQQRAEATER